MVSGGGGDRDGYSRVVHCNDPECPDAVALSYAGNAISTTKYTLANFVPKSLFEQFRRVANLFFLVVACISFTPLAPYRAVSVLLPLVLVVGATMAKEALEDWRRKQQDIEINNRKVRDSEYMMGMMTLSAKQNGKISELEMSFRWSRMSSSLPTCSCFPPQPVATRRFATSKR